MNPFTKHIHFIWLQGVTDIPAPLQPVPAAWKALHPNSLIHVWEEVGILNFIQHEYPQFLGFYQSIGTNDPFKSRMIKRCDFARVLLLYHFGGTYVDLDCIPHSSIDALVESHALRHRKSPYSAIKGLAARLEMSEPIERVDFRKYDVILNRECGPSHELYIKAGGGVIRHAISNAAMMAKPKSIFLLEFIGSMLARSQGPVLEFAGPWALSKFLFASIQEKWTLGKVCVLPFYYFMWNENSMGVPWRHSISSHLNRMDWIDRSKRAGWLA